MVQNILKKLLINRNESQLIYRQFFRMKAFLRLILEKITLLMNRFDRLASILIQLQSKKIVKAQEIADRFEISLRTVYRDVRSLEIAGIPIISEAGIGYSLQKEYRLPPVHFTSQEGLAFVTAEKLVSKLTDQNTLKSYQSALYKIKATLGQKEKEYINDAEIVIGSIQNANIHIKPQLFLQEILQSILSKNVIQLNYSNINNFDASEREIEPIGIYSQANFWYLVAFCRLRNDFRVFRTDRIKKIEILNQKFRTIHPNLNNFLNKTSSNKELSKVVIKIDKRAYKFLGDQPYYMGFVAQKDLGNQIEMTFLSPSLQNFSHWFLLLGSEADIIEPDILKIMVLEKLDNIKNRVNGNPHFK